MARVSYTQLWSWCLSRCPGPTCSEWALGGWGIKPWWKGNDFQTQSLLKSGLPEEDVAGRPADEDEDEDEAEEEEEEEDEEDEGLPSSLYLLF